MSKKKSNLIIASLFSGLFLLFYVILNIKNYINMSEIAFFDVGQGDSSLIKLPNNKLILIDGGPDNLVVNRIGRYLPYYQRKIDYVVLSHYHDDHIVGLIEIINRYDIGTLVYMGGSKKSKFMDILLDKAKQKNIQITPLINSMKINYQENCSINLLNPLSLKVKVDDNNSIVVKVSCGKMQAVFMGDSNISVEKALLNGNINWKTNIFKASHHGSKTANSEEFLKAMNPNLVVIPVGQDNRFNHPSPEVIDRLNGLNIEYKRTDELGNIVISSTN